MTEADPTIIDSPLSGIVRKDGVTVEVSIFRLEDDHEWSLEVVNEANTSIVWDEVFETDAAAMRSFWDVVAAEGMATFLGASNVVPFRR